MVWGFQCKFLSTRKLYLIYKVLSREFNEYLKSGSMLEAWNPDELAGFSLISMGFSLATLVWHFIITITITITGTGTDTACYCYCYYYYPL